MNWSMNWNPYFSVKCDFMNCGKNHLDFSENPFMYAVGVLKNGKIVDGMEIENQKPKSKKVENGILKKNEKSQKTQKAKNGKFSQDWFFNPKENALNNFLSAAFGK